MATTHIPFPFHNQEKWNSISKSLSSTISSPSELEAVMEDLCGHHSTFFSKYFEKENKFPSFFDRILPTLQKYALELPNVCSEPIALLYRAQIDTTVNLSQKQIASILACAFFGILVPVKEYNYDAQDLDFHDLYRSANQFVSSKTKVECIFNYFKRITEKEPSGSRVVSFHRKVLTKEMTPAWTSSNLLVPPVNMYTEMEIQDSHSLIHVDFANKYIGGGVLRRGSVQEEILFSIKPECLVSMLLCDKMDNNETVVIKGAERYSKHFSNHNQFLFESDYTDNTPIDSKGRLKTEIVAMDAIPVYSVLLQYTRESIQRDLNKAYCGFMNVEDEDEINNNNNNNNSNSNSNSNNGVSVATGHWGCGAFGGNKQLKFIQQLMAASQAGKSLEYFSFGDEDFTKYTKVIYDMLIEKKVTVGELYKGLTSFRAQLDKENDEGRELSVFSHLQNLYGENK